MLRELWERYAAGEDGPDDPPGSKFYVWARDQSNMSIKDAFTAAGKLGKDWPDEYFRCGTRPPANDREKAALERWKQAEKERDGWSNGGNPRAPTASERKLRERLRRAGLLETPEHARERERREFGTGSQLLLAAPASSAGAVTTTDFGSANVTKTEKGVKVPSVHAIPLSDGTVMLVKDPFSPEVSPRQQRRQKQNAMRRLRVAEMTPEQAARSQQVAVFNKLANRFLEFERNWGRASEHDRRLLLRNFPKALERLQDIGDEMLELLGM